MEQKQSPKRDPQINSHLTHWVPQQSTVLSINNVNQMNFQVENKINHESYHTPCKNLNTQVYRGKHSRIIFLALRQRIIRTRKARKHLQKLNIQIPWDSPCSPLVIYPTERHTYVPKDMLKNVHSRTVYSSQKLTINQMLINRTMDE